MTGAGPKALCGRQKKSLASEGSIDEASQVAGYEHKEFSGVTEAIILQSDPADGRIVGSVIQKDHPQPDSPEEIEPEVPLDRLGVFLRLDLIHGTTALSRVSKTFLEPILRRINVSVSHFDGHPGVDSKLLIRGSGFEPGDLKETKRRILKIFYRSNVRPENSGWVGRPKRASAAFAKKRRPPGGGL